MPGEAAEAVKNVALSEDFFDDHFPRHPIMPGVLILEGIAQVSGLLLEASLKQRHDTSAKAVLTVIGRTKFRRMVKPGDTLVYHTEVVALNEAGGKVKARAEVGGAVAATTEMAFAFRVTHDPKLDETRRALLDLWLATD